MGAITGMLGLGGGQSGTGIAGPQSASIMPTVNSTQLGNANSYVQNSLQTQQDLLAALQAQNGLGNQNQVYGQLQGIANGTGPNPAQAQYEQNANEIGAKTAGLIGSQKGISPAMQARLIAMQGASAQQNAAGQGAANLANQQLGALQAAGNMANTQAGQQLGQVNAYAAATQNAQNALLNAATGQNNASVNNQSSINNANSTMSGQMMQNQAKGIGGIGNAFGAVTGLFANGGMVDGPQSSFGKSLTMKGGGFVPGQAKVAGDSNKNDVVNAKLSPGEIVLPRTVVNSKNPEDAAARFVAAVLAKKGKK